MTRTHLYGGEIKALKKGLNIFEINQTDDQPLVKKKCTHSEKKGERRVCCMSVSALKGILRYPIFRVLFKDFTSFVSASQIEFKWHNVK